MFQNIYTKRADRGEVVLWRRGAVVNATAQLHSTNPELRFWAGSNPARSVRASERNSVVVGSNPTQAEFL